MSTIFAKPENALKRAEELINVGQKQAALQALHDLITSKRYRAWQKTLERIMFKYVELCVDMRRGRFAKDGLIQYRIVCQQVNVSSLEEVIKHFLHLSTERAEQARSQAQALEEALDVDDLEADKRPEDLMLSYVSGEKGKDRSDRELVTPWFKFLWETYRTVLEILRNNSKLEALYAMTAHRAFQFCKQYKRSTEFRRLCEIIRNHLANLNKYRDQRDRPDLSAPESLQLYLDTRFEQLKIATELELWQEAFRSVEDVHNLMCLVKKTPKPSLMVVYYAKLTEIFWVSDSHLYHAYAWLKLFSLQKSYNKNLNQKDLQLIASSVMLAALAVSPYNHMHGASHLELENEKERNLRMAGLIGFVVEPKRESRELLSRSTLISEVIVKLDSHLTEIGQLGDAIVIVDSSTEEEEHFESANSLKIARKKASTSTVINTIKKREIAFKRCLSNSLRDLMGRRKSGNRIHVLLTLADLINASKNHGVMTNDGEAKRARINGSFASCSRSKQRLCCDTNPLLPSEMVEHLRKGIGSHGQIVHVEEISARTPVHVETPNELSENIRSALKRIGVFRLYSHQAESIQASLNGKSVVVATMTSSGKSLCYNIPVLEALSQDLFSCALYLFPTKALAQDQLRALSVMTEGMDICIDMGLYDGDTPQEDRCHVRDNARLLITNPDMLHMSVLPFHTQFRRILSNLRFVVIDEAHAYKGAFGCHTALILRRLRRLCWHVYGKDPSFIFSTATSANPCEHAKELVGLSTLELIKNDGSPSSLKSFVMWNPPLNLKNVSKPSSGNDTSESAGTGVINARRSSPISEVSRLFAEMVQHGLRCIAFCKTRKLCELVLANTREILQETAPNLVDSICVYRAGYTAQDRRRIEREFFGGKLSGVAATNALELGIDVGHIDTTLHLGFPGGISSLWQQAGRSGRRERPSLAVYVAFEGPVDQYFMKFPEKLFRSPIECCHIDAQNKQVLEQHIVCAAHEHPLSLLYDEKYFGSGLESAIAGLSRKGYLSSDPSCDSLARIWSYIGHEKKPSYGISIRAIETEKYKVVDVKRDEVLEEIEESKAFFQVYEGAVYLHQGKTYLVKELDVIEKIALCQEADLKYYTKTRDYTDIHVLGEDMIYPEKISETRHLRTTAHACTCKVTTTWFGFHRIWRGSNEIFDTVELSLPKYSYESQAVWVRVPQSIKAAVGTQELPFRSGLHAAGHTLLNVVPLFIQCNSSDLGTECVNPHGTRKFHERILLYDQHPGGSGIAAQVQPLFGVLLNAALDLLRTCSCYGETGCPNCIQVLSCREYNNILDKSAAIIILQVSGKELHTTESANKMMSTSIDRKESPRCSGLGTCLCEFFG